MRVIAAEKSFDFNGFMNIKKICASD